MGVWKWGRKKCWKSGSKGSPNRPQKLLKIDKSVFWRGLKKRPQKWTLSRIRKSEILPLFTTLELGPTSQKGTPFWSHFGDLFSQKNEKRGFQKRPKNQSPKTLKMGPKQGGGVFQTFGSFLRSEPCSDPLCCWNAPGPLFFIILASLFLHFCVAARCKEQLQPLQGTAPCYTQTH